MIKCRELLINDELLTITNWCPREHAYLKEEFEDTKGVIRSRKSKKNRQHNGQKKKVQRDKQHTHKGKKHIITDLQLISYKHLKTLMILLGDQNKQVISLGDLNEKVINNVQALDASDLH